MPLGKSYLLCTKYLSFEPHQTLMQRQFSEKRSVHRTNTN